MPGNCPESAESFYSMWLMREVRKQSKQIKTKKSEMKISVSCDRNHMSPWYFLAFTIQNSHDWCLKLKGGAVLLTVLVRNHRITELKELEGPQEIIKWTFLLKQVLYNKLQGEMSRRVLNISVEGGSTSSLGSPSPLL